MRISSVFGKPVVPPREVTRPTEFFDNPYLRRSRVPSPGEFLMEPSVHQFNVSSGCRCCSAAQPARRARAGTETRRGAKIFRQLCVKCHGPEWRGVKGKYDDAHAGLRTRIGDSLTPYHSQEHAGRCSPRKSAWARMRWTSALQVILRRLLSREAFAQTPATRRTRAPDNANTSTRLPIS